MISLIQRTLLLVKPDGVQRGLTGEILKRFENVGLKVVGMKMVWINEEFAAKHYSDVKMRPFAQSFLVLFEISWSATEAAVHRVVNSSFSGLLLYSRCNRPRLRPQAETQ